jgi:cytochrome c peroxidase
MYGVKGSILRRGWPVLFLAAGLMFAGTAIGDEPLWDRARATFRVVGQTPPEALDQPVVKLGQALFWDARLSANGKIACASCHLADEGSADKRPFSKDARDHATSRNSQPIFNALLQPALRWTADRKSGSAQAQGSLTGSMGWNQVDEVIPVLEESGYRPLFTEAFPDDPQPLSVVRFGEAVEAYEMTLTTPAPFDRYLSGDKKALDDVALKGLERFLTIGCADCHHGKLLGGEELAKFGVRGDYYRLATGLKTSDDGRFKTTKNEADRHVFRVAMVRNIDQTAPYFHDGSVRSLSRAIAIMGQLQLDRDLATDEIAEIEAFLKTLTGETPVNYVASVLPPGVTSAK